MIKGLTLIILLIILGGCYSTGYQPQYILSQESAEKTESSELKL